MQQQQSVEPSVREGNTLSLSGERARQREEGRVTQPVQAQSFLASVLVPRATSTRDITALETAMQGLAPDARHPVALELAATASSRHFLLRATSAMSLRHLTDQVQARYPQAIIRPMAETDDPLFLREEENVSIVELRAGAATYLPLHAWRERQLLQEGADPLLGILGVFNHLPPQMRMVAQLALIPAPPTWSRPYRRKSVEHPLEQEHLHARREMSGGQASGPSTFQLVGMGILVALLLVWWRWKPQLDAFIPSWVIQLVFSLLHGTSPHLLQAHLTTLVLGSIVALMALFFLAFALLQIRNRMGTTAPYDMRLVDEKTARPAYRVRLRLFAFSTQPRTVPAHHTRLAKALVQCLCRQPFTWASLKKVYRDFREARERDKQGGQERDDALLHLVAAYRQYHTAAGGYFVPRQVTQRKARRLLARQMGRVRSRLSGWNHDIASSPHMLSVADIAALWHLPQAQDLADLPYLERTRARTALAPAELTQGHGWKTGTSSHAGQCVPVSLPGECLRHNLLAVASTGKGKSTLFQHLAQAVCLMRNGMDEAVRPGLAFIEPHGDVVHALCGLLPARERDSVVLVDLADGDYPVGINPLDMTGRDRDKAVDTLITLSEHLWAASYGSRTENVLEYALKTLADANEWFIQSDPYQGPERQYTLLDVVPLLRLASFRHAVLEQVRDGLLLDWWQHYFEPMDAHQQREITSSVITKLSKFASSRVARRILGQPRSTLDLREVIRSGKLLLVSTASGVVGADLSELIGIVLLGLFEAALAEQAAVSFEQRRRYLVLIDEFQVYRGANYQGMLAELRKYGGSFALAIQSLAYLDRLDRTLRATVLANIDHPFAFHIAGEDARLLHELDGMEEEELTNLDDFQCYVKLSLGGHRLPVFSLQMDAPPRPDENAAQFVRLRSRQRDARPAGVVDDLIRQSQARHFAGAPTTRRAPGRRMEEESAKSRDDAGEEAGSVRRHKKTRKATPPMPEAPRVKRRMEHKPTTQELVKLCEFLTDFDWRLLHWLLRYPLQRADDLMVGVARWASRATVYRHVQALEARRLLESVLPKRPGAGKRLYHLSNVGLHLLARHLERPAGDLVRHWHADETGLLALLPRLPTLLVLQDAVNGLVDHAAEAMTTGGRRPRLVRWNWQRDVTHRFRYRERRMRFFAAGAVALCIRTQQSVDSTLDEWYGLFILFTELDDERLMRLRLERLLCWRESPERWCYYHHMLPVLILAWSSRQHEHWQRAVESSALKLRLEPLKGALACLPQGESARVNPWLLPWRTLSTDVACHLQDLLTPLPQAAFPLSLPLAAEGEDEEQGARAPASATCPTASTGAPLRLRSLTVGDLARRLSRIMHNELEEQEVVALLGLRLTSCQWHILRLLLAHPWLSDEDLAAFLHLQRRSVRCALYALHRLGCLEPVPTEIGKRWHLCARGLRLIAAANHTSIRNFAVESDDEGARNTPTVVQRGESGLMQHIQHTAGVYGFFARLKQTADQEAGRELCWWETGAACERRYRVGEQWFNLRPDALAEYRSGQRRFRFWLEWDRGTMNVRDLAVKFSSYAHYVASREWARECSQLPWLLCVAPELAQERRIQRVAQATLKQATGLILRTTTALLLHAQGPLAPVWSPCLPLGDRGAQLKDSPRRSLFERLPLEDDRLS